MKVFLSWSGLRSREVADALKDWISCVLQAVKPWVSTQDIERGAVWFSEIGSQLQDTVVGIICLTEENKARPWILFEAGALAKGLSTSRVCTLLIDLTPADVHEPLSQFNHTLPTKESMLSLVRTLNAALGERALDPKILAQVFETYYPQFEEQFQRILLDTPSAEPGPPRSPDETLGEILGLSRSLANRLSRVEGLIESRAEEEVVEIDPNAAYAVTIPGPIKKQSEVAAFTVAAQARSAGKTRLEAMRAIRHLVPPLAARRLLDHLYPPANS